MSTNKLEEVAHQVVIKSPRPTRTPKGEWGELRTYIVNTQSYAIIDEYIIFKQATKIL